MLSILSVLVRCDTCSVWMVQRVVEYALLVADSVVDNTVVDGGQSKQQLLKLTREIQVKCGATIQINTALVDKLSREVTQQQQLSSVKAEVCSLLRGKSGSASVSSGSGSKSRSLSVQSEISPRPLSSKELLAGSSERNESSDYKKLLQLPSGEQGFTSGLKSVRGSISRDDFNATGSLCIANVVVLHVQILRLRKTADMKSEASGLRIVELLLQLKQHVKSFPDTAVPPPTKASSYVSMDAMLGNSNGSSSSTNDSSGNKLSEFSRLALPVALVRGCEEIVRLGSDLYVKESGLSSRSQAELVQVLPSCRLACESLNNLTDFVVCFACNSSLSSRESVW